MPKNFYYIESNLPKKYSKKIIEHATLDIYDSKKLYNIGDQFQDSTGVTYTTIKSNKKFCILANVYATTIKGINVSVASYLDPELFDTNICNDPLSSNYDYYKDSCTNDSDRYDNQMSVWKNTLESLLPNIATNFYKMDNTQIKSTIPTYDAPSTVKYRY